MRTDGGSGFTLIEVLVTVVILGILAAVVVFAATGGNSGSVDDHKHCDGTNLVYEDFYGETRAVVANSPQCGGAAPTVTSVPG